MIERFKKILVFIIVLSILLPNNIYALTNIGATLQNSTITELYNEISKHLNQYDELYISTENELRVFSQYVRNGNTCEGKTIYLVNNIVLDKNNPWLPIGGESYATNIPERFNGTFDGRGYTIENINFDGALDFERYFGLFGYIGEKGVVKRVKVKNLNIPDSYQECKNYYFGNIAGYCEGRIEYCEITCSYCIDGLDSCCSCKFKDRTDVVANWFNNKVGYIAGHSENPVTINKEIIEENNHSLGMAVCGNFSSSNKKMCITYKDLRDINYNYQYTFGEGEDTVNFYFFTNSNLYSSLGDINLSGKNTELYLNIKMPGQAACNDLEYGFGPVSEKHVKRMPAVLIDNEYFEPIGVEEANGYTLLKYKYIPDTKKEIKNAKIEVFFNRNIDGKQLGSWTFYNETNKYIYMDLNNTVFDNLYINLCKDSLIEIETSAEDLVFSEEYTEGEEIYVKIKATRQLKTTDEPQVIINFSKSGDKVAECIKTELDEDLKSVWTYKYTVQLGDGGNLQIGVTKGNLQDLYGISQFLDENPIYFNVDNIFLPPTEPEIVFENLTIKEISNIKYVKIKSGITKEQLTLEMNTEALAGAIPTYTELTYNGRTRTGTKISLNEKAAYIVIVTGDVNGDGKVSPTDLTYANSIRLNKVNSTTEQREAVDFNSDEKINALDLTMINSYRLGKIKE